MDEEWAVLASLLPEGWQELARETGAMRRARGGIRSPEVLLQLLLLHVATGLSLKQASARAEVQKLASVTDVALLKRLRSSEEWLREMARRMFDTSRFASTSSELPAGRRLRAVDATTVEISVHSAGTGCPILPATKKPIEMTNELPIAATSLHALIRHQNQRSR